MSRPPRKRNHPGGGVRTRPRQPDNQVATRRRARYRSGT